MPKSYIRYAASTPRRFDVPRLELEVTDKRPYDVVYKPKYYDTSYRPRDRVRRTPTPPHYRVPPKHPPYQHHHHYHHKPRYSPPPPSQPYRAPHHGLTRRSPNVIYDPRPNDVIHKPPQNDGVRQYMVSERRTRSVCRCCNHHRHRHRHHHHPHRQPHRDPKGQYTHRAATYGMDRGYFSNEDEDDSECCSCCNDAARARLYTHDSNDPYSCMCFPSKSSKTIPAMMYDGVRCPHPDHQFPPAKQDVFAYPWTVHTNRPQRILEYGYKQGQVRPPSAVTAPPFALYNKKEPRPQVKEPPPHTAPVKKTSAPLLSSDPSDRRLRRAERQRLAPLPEDEADEISPFDSVSQVSPLRTHRSPSLRLRTVDQQTRRRVDTELRMASRNRALSTPPRPRPLLDNEGFPQTPTRIFKGEYIDPKSGEVHEYDIKYGKQALGGSRNLKTT
ncbi:uncharacterized protein [Littorina saxatilis]|uniref:Uncharacterized protein n=1 Tax=Littorina saxatilis TaxID=31220 RepID=A0AAN9AJH3_9CAEN